MSKDEALILLAFSLSGNLTALLIAHDYHKGWAAFSALAAFAMVFGLDAWLRGIRKNSN